MGLLMCQNEELGAETTGTSSVPAHAPVFANGSFFGDGVVKGCRGGKGQCGG